MAQLWLDHPQSSHLSPDDMMYLHLQSIMYNSGRSQVPFYPLSPYGLSGLAAALDCSNLNPPADPTYANCAPTDSTCVAGNTQLNAQHNVDVQAYHDAIAACSAEKFQQSGGTLTPSALTYGAGMDLSTGDVYTAPVAPLSAFVQAGQPFQTPAQRAASEAALSVQDVPLMWSSSPSVVPVKAPGNQPGIVPANTGVTPATQTVPQATMQPGTPPATGSNNGTATPPASTILGMDPTTFAIVAAAGLGLFLLSKGGK